MKLSGRIIEKWSQIPVSGAVVNVNGTIVIADTAGNFSINVMQSRANIQVMHIGYTTVTETATVNGDMSIEIELIPTARALH